MSVARSTGKSSDRMKNIESSLAGSYEEEDYAGNSKYLKDKIKHFETKVEDGTSNPKYGKAKELLSKLQEKFPGKSTTVKKTVTVKANRSSSPKASAPKAAPKSAVDKAAATAKAAQEKAAKAAAAAAEAMKKAEEAARKAQTVAENAAKPKVAKSSTRKVKNTKNTVPNIYTNMSKITHSPSGRAYGPENSLKNIAHNLERAYILAQTQYRKSRKNKNSSAAAASASAASASAAPAAAAPVAPLPSALPVVAEESASSSSTGTSLSSNSGRSGNSNNENAY
jgi:hypothetical protein